MTEKKYTPLGETVTLFIEPSEQEDNKTVGGIILPGAEKVEEPLVEALVTGVGSGVNTSEYPLKKGEKVLLYKSQAYELDESRGIYTVGVNRLMVKVEV